MRTHGSGYANKAAHIRLCSRKFPGSLPWLVVICQIILCFPNPGLWLDPCPQIQFYPIKLSSYLEFRFYSSTLYIVKFFPLKGLWRLSCTVWCFFICWCTFLPLTCFLGNLIKPVLFHLPQLPAGGPGGCGAEPGQKVWSQGWEERLKGSYRRQSPSEFQLYWAVDTPVPAQWVGCFKRVG